MSDDTGIRVPVPAGYSAEEAAAFRAGFRTCAQLFGQAAETYQQAAAGDADEDATTDDAEPDEEMTDCPECGAGLLSSMGADETATPAGTVCPECEL